jgi:hypothetical protein
MELSILYDKSALQPLTSDEAKWLGHFFHTVLTPVILTEIVADLTKDSSAGLAGGKFVSTLAGKIRSLHAYLNVDYREMIRGNLLGYEVNMCGIPIIARGQEIVAETGERAMLFEETVEEDALHRWSRGEFRPEDQSRANHWRETIAKLDISLIAKDMDTANTSTFDITSLESIATVTSTLLGKRELAEMYIRGAWAIFGLPHDELENSLRSWMVAEKPALNVYAPYAAFCLRVMLTFHMGVAVGHLATQRNTDFVDVNYLLYLPFAKVFASDDRLHKRLAPVFMTAKQRFITGRELKSSLADLVRYYEGKEDELKRHGMMGFARHLPFELNTPIHRLFDDLEPDWRRQSEFEHVEVTPERSEAIMKKMKPMLDAIEKAQRAKKSNTDT